MADDLDGHITAIDRLLDIDVRFAVFVNRSQSKVLLNALAALVLQILSVYLLKPPVFGETIWVFLVSNKVFENHDMKFDRKFEKQRGRSECWRRIGAAYHLEMER